MNKFLATALAGAAMTCVAGTANAAVTLTATSITSVYTSNVPTADLHKTNDPTKEINDVKVTPETLKGTLKDGAGPAVPVEFFAYCVDIFQTAGPTTFTVVSLADYLGGNTTKLNRITALIAAEGTKENKLHDAAVQLALWELMNESSSNGLDIDKMVDGHWESYWWFGQKKYRWVDDSPKQFWADDVKNGSGVLANTDAFLAAAATDAGKPAPGLNLFVAKSSTKQDFLFWTITPPPAVPEPATWAMMLMGFGGIGYAMRAKRRNSAVSFA